MVLAAGWRGAGRCSWLCEATSQCWAGGAGGVWEGRVGTHSLGDCLGGHLPLVGQLELQALHLLLPLWEVHGGSQGLTGAENQDLVAISCPGPPSKTCTPQRGVPQAGGGAERGAPQDGEGDAVCDTQVLVLHQHPTKRWCLGLGTAPATSDSPHRPAKRRLCPRCRLLITALFGMVF